MNNINLTELIPVADCITNTIEEGLELKGTGYARTDKLYKVPLKIELVAKTDSTNIRLHYAKGQIILLWEESLEIVPLHEPIFGHDYKIRDIEKLSANEWIKCTWIILENSMQISINDKEVFSHSIEDKVITLGSGMPWILPKYHNLEGFVSIGPAWGSTITVSSLKIEEM